MVLTDKSVRFSLASCKTEDSVVSSAIATPIDASPQPRPLNPPSAIINIINDDPLPNTRAYPIVRRSAQSSANSSSQTNASNSTSETTITENSFAIKKLWPKFKHLISKSNGHEDNIKHMLDSLHIQQKTDSKKASEPQNKRWLGRNKSRVGPQI
ncbi:hypothetical protein BY458DRAFT_522161 [Sporodiniella umbellata]|nr:hypothetical protein BY458DRAFT_522161 [Sporodiniella umbellata]